MEMNNWSFLFYINSNLAVDSFVIQGIKVDDIN